MNNLFTLTLKSLGLPPPIFEHHFKPPRKESQRQPWRIDASYPEIKLAIEFEGGVYTYGRHNRPAGFLNDMIKYNALTLEGWRLLRYQPTKINYDEIVELYNKLSSNSFNDKSIASSASSTVL